MRKTSDARVQRRIDLKQRSIFRNPLLPLFGRNPVHIRYKVEILKRLKLHKNFGIVRYIADFPLCLQRALPHIGAADKYLPLIRSNDAGNHFDGRRLSRPVRPQKPENLPTLRLKRKIVNRLSVRTPVRF